MRGTLNFRQVHELQAALTAALGLAMMPPPGTVNSQTILSHLPIQAPDTLAAHFDMQQLLSCVCIFAGPAEAPWANKLPASLATAGYYKEPEGNAAGVQDDIDRAFGSSGAFEDISNSGSGMASAPGIQLPGAGADAGRLAAFRESVQPPRDGSAAAAAAWQRLVPAISAAGQHSYHDTVAVFSGRLPVTDFTFETTLVTDWLRCCQHISTGAGLAPAVAEAHLAAAGLPRPAALLAALQRAGRHLTLCSDRWAQFLRSKAVR